MGRGGLLAEPPCQHRGLGGGVLRTLLMFLPSHPCHPAWTGLFPPGGIRGKCVLFLTHFFGGLEHFELSEGKRKRWLQRGRGTGADGEDGGSGG